MGIESPDNAEQDPLLPVIERVTETMGGRLGAAAVTGAHPEAPHPGDTFRLPSDILDLLEHGLTDADMPGGVTQKFLINGHPDLLVRKTHGAKTDPSRRTMFAASILGLPLTPARIVEHQGETYHITKRVQGECLEDLLPTASPELLAAVDATWERLVHACKKSFTESLPWPFDIEGPDQFMWGTIPGYDDRPQLWLTDLPDDTLDLRRDDQQYAYELFYMLRALRDIEAAANTRIENTREALAEAIAAIPDSSESGDGIRNAAKHCLDHHEDIFRADEEDDFFLSFRTN